MSWKDPDYAKEYYRKYYQKNKEKTKQSYLNGEFK